ncbi:hypothetical protein [Streptomyces sp. URMC 123]|uniref:hypothetical protein n=1 Tax=Streptomyces sp. URMC 123 TaxID=3423403 RepID=UPI003F1D66B5
MFKKSLACAAAVAAFMAVGAASTAAHACDHKERGYKERGYIAGAAWGGGKHQDLRTASGTGIYSGAGHHGAFLAGKHYGTGKHYGKR